MMGIPFLSGKYSSQPRAVWHYFISSMEKSHKNIKGHIQCIVCSFPKTSILEDVLSLSLTFSRFGKPAFSRLRLWLHTWWRECPPPHNPQHPWIIPPMGTTLKSLHIYFGLHHLFWFSLHPLQVDRLGFIISISHRKLRLREGKG